MNYRSTATRSTGIAIPLGALRTAGGWVVGEYPDLTGLAGLCSKAGLSLVQLLPVNDSGGQSSPYSALSAFALHPLYLRLADLPEAARCPGVLADFERASAALRDVARYPYAAALAVKLAALRAIHDANREAIAADRSVDAFIEENDWVKPYAVYKRLKAANAEASWRAWPEYRDPGPAGIQALWEDPAARDEQRFHAWTQMRCAGQFGKASGELARAGITLLGDLPILMNEDSADVWAERGNFRLESRAGAPPDMFAEFGQNWGFPIYDWEAMAADGHSFWRRRIAQADRYYSAYRIDHVLGFFRIWALPERESSGYLGRFLPGLTLSRAELAGLGFDAGRLRWISEPHIPTADLYDAAHDVPDSSGAVLSAMSLALDRIGTEELFLFKRSIRGERDLEELELPAPVREFLLARWRDRVLVPVRVAGDGSPDGAAAEYVPAWRPESARAWSTLSGAEQRALRALFDSRRQEEQALWLERGRELLGTLKGFSSMLPCAEDLGAVPPGVPETLQDLGMLGLRIPRWTRYWDRPGSPFIPLREFPELSVCTPSVHDTSTLRGWWEKEGGREGFAAAYCPGLKPVPAALDPASALVVLRALAAAASRLFVLQAQDLLDLSPAWRSADPSEDRVNVPGAVDDFNWTWRMRPSVEDLVADADWLRMVRTVAESR